MRNFTSVTLINQINLLQAFVLARHRCTAFHNGAYLEGYAWVLVAHSGSRSSDFDFRACLQRGIHLIADGIGEAVLVRAANRRVGNVQALAIGGDRHLWHHGHVHNLSRLREANAMKVKESLRALWLLWTASPLALRLFGLFHLWSFCHEVDGVLAGESLNGGNLRSEDG